MKLHVYYDPWLLLAEKLSAEKERELHEKWIKKHGIWFSGYWPVASREREKEWEEYAKDLPPWLRG